MKKYKTMFIVFLILLLTCPLAFGNYQKNVTSKITNQILPEFNFQDGQSWPEYFNERSLLHDECISRYLYGNDLIFNELAHPTYAYGKNGYVFFRPSEIVLDTNFIDSFCRYIRQVQDYCNQRGVPFLFCLNPSKDRVYREKLPDGYNLSNKQIDYFYERLEKEGVNYISNIEYLTEIAKKKQIYNRKFDAGHWNDLGAFYATNRLLLHMKKEYPDIAIPTIEDFNVSTQCEKYLPLSTFTIDENVPDLTYKKNNKPKNISDEFQDLEMDYQHRIFEINKLNIKQNLDLPRVLFFAGSYYNRNRAFYNSSFRETYSIHNYENFLNFDYYFNVFQPDYVVFVAAEYTINKNYYNPTILDQKKLNMPLSEALEAYNSTRVKLPENLSNNSDTIRTLDNKRISDFQLEKKGALGKLSFKNNDGYKFGYFKKGDIILDLSINENEISCTTNINHTTFDGGELILFH